MESVLKSGHQYRRIDVVFDRYRPESIKSDTRSKRSKGTRPSRKLIEDNSVPLPNSWPDFIALSVISAAFKEEDTVKSSDLSLDISPLKGWHEEADTLSYYTVCMYIIIVSLSHPRTLMSSYCWLILIKCLVAIYG